MVPDRSSAPAAPGQTRVSGRTGLPGPVTALVGLLSAVLLAVLTASLIAGTATLIGQITPMRAEERQAQALADHLRRTGITRVYGEYWTCNRLTFNADEEVVCAVLSAQLRPGQNRYGPYQEQVNAAPRPGYVLEAGSLAEAKLVDRLRTRGVPVEISEVGRYRIYHPTERFQPW